MSYQFSVKLFTCSINLLFKHYVAYQFPLQFYTCCINGPLEFYTVDRILVFSNPICKHYSEARARLHIYSNCIVPKST